MCRVLTVCIEGMNTAHSITMPTISTVRKKCLDFEPFSESDSAGLDFSVTSSSKPAASNACPVSSTMPSGCLYDLIMTSSVYRQGNMFRGNAKRIVIVMAT